MYLVTSNEKNDLTNWQRRQDVLDIHAALPAQPIVLWQEIRHPDQHGDIMMKVPTGTYHAFPYLPIPISVPARYEVLEEWSVPAKPWTGKTIDGPGLGEVGDQPRWYGILRLQDTKHPLTPSFYVANTHMTNGCEWSDPDPSDVALTLRPYWTDHWDLMRSDIRNILGQEATVFWGGDTNRKVFPPFTPDEKLAVGENRIDKLAVTERSVLAVLKDTGTIVTRSDHNARWAKWSLERA